MVDLSNKTIKNLFEEQIRRLTAQTIATKVDSFDYQFSGGWIK